MIKTLKLAFIIFMLIFLPQAAWAAPDANSVQTVRYFSYPEKVRVVVELSAPPEYKTLRLDDPFRLVIDLAHTANKTNLKKQEINDPFVSAIRMGTGADATRIVMDCKLPVTFKVFTLTKPDRLVIDLVKITEQKKQQEIQPGITYTAWTRAGNNGPLSIHILDIAPQSGYTVKPALVRGTSLGVGALSSVFRSGEIIAAVNASYFAANGNIIGLLKIDNEIISSSSIARTALACLPDGTLQLDQRTYQGGMKLPDGSVLPLDGVNEERGENSLVLYNRWFGPTTRTNGYGVDYTVIAGAVTSIQAGNAPIPPNGMVVSAHGEAAKKLAGLKVGDSVKIEETLGDWDQAAHVVGAGPMLVKNGHVFLTTKIEEFGSDVAGGRAPRTALGLTKDKHVLLAVIDGRQSMSVGMTLLELALLMQELGAVDAMNLDGGGSSEMMINGRIVNKPSDGRERRVGNALVVVPAQLAI